MAYEVRLAASAVTDLDRIYSEKQAETSPPAAEWFLGLRDAILSLGAAPYLGPVTRENPELRHLLYGNKPHIYRIIYSVDEGARHVNVAQIRHGARRPLPPRS